MAATKHLYTIALYFLAALLAVQAQSHKVLLERLSKQSPGTERVTTLLDLGNYYIYKAADIKTDLDSAYIFTQQAEQESKQLKYTYGSCRSLALYARIYGAQKDKAKSNSYANKALQVALAHNYQDIAGEAYQELYAQCNYYEELTKKMLYLDKAIAAYRKKSSKLQLADILTIAAEDYNYMGDKDKPMAFINESLALYKSIGHKDMVNAYRVAGSLYASRGDYKKSVQYLLQAVKAAEDMQNIDELLSYIYNQLAANYHHLKDNALSDKYLKISLDYALKAGNTEMVYTATNNIVYSLINLAKYKEAEKFLKRIYGLHKPTNPVDILTVKDCFLTIYARLHQFDRAEAYSREIVNLINAKGTSMPPQSLYNAYASLCNFYVEKGDYGTARKYLNTNLIDIEKRSFTSRKRIYQLAYKIDSAQGNLAQAITYLKKIKTVDDSIFNIEKNKEISQLQISYETEKKDKDILLLNKEKELQKQNIEKAGIQKNIALTGGLIAILAAIAIFYAYRNKLKLTNLLQKQKIEITDKNEKLNKLVDEKEWLLKEIHHRVKNNLQVVMSLLNTQSAYLTDEAARTAITDSQRRVHSIALIHQQLYKSDDVSAIKLYRYISDLVSYLKDTYDRSLIKFDINVDDIELNIALTMPIGLILNEAITNSFKYAFNAGEKGNIRISLCRQDNGLYELLIADNGRGLPPDFDVHNCNSLGMDLLSGLSGDINGEFKIYSNGGTIIQIVFDADVTA
ncbi:hypothetical protein GR160_16375 [Flavobacterium sp. Sd200]|uniref:tetratricopeptide repeat-containing sensor histidine kinase n=1 Tax=Flavobacterium sp. Sd200 TaxID=2692211 RepID=UPI00136D15A0|nr:sensor histidine kinase [Flavobacterium sp. Sd200]MXN92805.1 hypothetical protein [Flavobacterium sp. Sd200]